MARKRVSIEDELRRIEEEEKRIEAEEKAIAAKEDIIRVFEELGLMRWKSYYVLTAGAILLLALTFVTALWAAYDELIDLQLMVGRLSSQVSALEVKIDNMGTSSAPNPALQDLANLPLPPPPPEPIV